MSSSQQTINSLVQEISLFVTTRLPKPQQEYDESLFARVIDEFEKEFWPRLKEICQPVTQSSQLASIPLGAVHTDKVYMATAIGTYFGRTSIVEHEELAYWAIRAFWGLNNRHSEFHYKLMEFIVMGLASWHVWNTLSKDARNNMAYGYFHDSGDVYPLKLSKDLGFSPEVIELTILTLIEEAKTV